MNMNDRYEIKFILDEGKLSEFLNWLYVYTELTPAFHSRHVNSLYFDDCSYESVRDNLAGISERRKMRLRWYHEEDKKDISLPALEFKFRNGRLGHKHRINVPRLKDDLLNIQAGEIYPCLCEELANNQGAQYFMDDYYIPTLHLSYLRDYYEDVHGLRVTIDRETKFYQVSQYSLLLQDSGIQYPLHVAEMKFPPELKRNVVEMLRSLHLTPKRHSKYLVGLASFGQVVYT